jgi:hypothetical protein
MEEIRCSYYSPNFSGFIKAAYDSWRGKLPHIQPLSHLPQRYDLVVVGGPIWAWHPATPVRTYLRDQRSNLSSVAFFLTHGGSGSEHREMEMLAGQMPKATLVVREKDVKEGNFKPAVASFTRATLKSKAD